MHGRTILWIFALALGCTGSGMPGADGGPAEDSGSADTGSAVDSATLLDGALDGMPDEGDTGGPTGSCPAGARAVFDTQVDRFASALAGDGVPGAVVVMVCGDETFIRPIGVVRAGGDPVLESTRFQIASLTKSWTGLVAARMSAFGSIDLEASVETFFPEISVRYEGAGTAPTISQLLSHSAGYPPDPTGINVGGDSLTEFARLNTTVTLLSPPGGVFNYANYGFALAGAALEQGSGRSFEALVQEQLLSPAGMNDASMNAAEVAASGDFAYGHSSEFSTEPLGPLDSYFDIPSYAPMGGGWASARDLAAFARYLIAGGSAVVTATAPRIRVPETLGEYGLGFFLELDGSAPVWSHGGSSPGFLTTFEVMPTLGYAVGVMVASEDTSADLSEPFEAIREALFRYEYGGIEPESVENQRSWVGTYSDPVNFGMFSVRMAGGSAEVAWGDGTSTAIDSWAADVGVITLPGESYPSSISFWRDGSGAVQYLVTTVGVGVRR